MFNKGQLAGLMKQAQAMQENMKKAQNELGNIEVSGESGSGLVKVTMTCKHEVRRVTLTPACWARTKTCLKIWSRPLSMRHCAWPKKRLSKKWARSPPACQGCPVA